MHFMENISASQEPTDKRFMRALKTVHRFDVQHAIKKGSMHVDLNKSDPFDETERDADEPEEDINYFKEPNTPDGP
jgi:hypothetical protein